MNNLKADLLHHLGIDRTLSPLRDIRWLATRVCISVVLATSATSKLYSWSTTYSGDASFLHLNPLFSALLVPAEYTLAILLLFDAFPKATLAIATLFISLLTGVSGWLVASGAHTCPCFGYLSPSPRVVLGLDLLMLVSLLLRMRAVSGSLSVPYRYAPISGIVRFVGIVVLLVGAGIETRYLSSSARFRDLIALVFPGRIQVQPKTINLSLAPDELRQVDFQITNHSSTSCAVVGGTFGCGPEFCIENVSLPIEIAPGATRSATISLGRQISEGSFSRDFVLYTSSSERPTLNVRINIKVSKPR